MEVSASSDGDDGGGDGEGLVGRQATMAAPRRKKMSLPLRHPDILTTPLEEEEEEEERELNLLQEESKDAFNDLYERTPPIPTTLLSCDDFPSRRDRSRSLPAVHGQFHLLHRNWTTPQMLWWSNRTRNRAKTER